MKNAKIYTEKPKGFKPQVEVASNWIEAQEEFLFVQKSGDAFEDLVWSLPGGKLENGEDQIDACIREVDEETGIKLKADQISFVMRLYISKPGFDYIYHMYHTKLDEQPEIHLSHEHCDFHWADLDSAKELNLLTGGEQILEFFQRECRE